MVAEAEDLKDYIILIDEPALYLHPGGQKDVLKEINELAKKNQIIYSNHSPFMVDRRFPKRVRFLLKEVQDGYSLSRVSAPTKADIFRDPLLRSALVYTVSDISYLNELNILVEGSLDRRLITLITNWLVNQGITENVIDMNLTAIIDCDGAAEIAKHAKLYKSNGLICVSLYDSDKKGEDAKRNNKAQTPDELLEIKDILNIPDTTVEDMIPSTVFGDAFALWEVKSQANSVVVPRMKEIASVLDKHLANQELSGDETSQERKRLKHSLDDLIVEEMEKYLQTAKRDDVKSLCDLVEILNKKVNLLLSLATKIT